MGFKTANQAWRLRHTTGRTPRFATPQALWQAATDYFEWVDQNPWMKTEHRIRPTTSAQGAQTCLIDLPLIRPYTLSGLCAYWRVSQSYWRKFKESKRDDESFQWAINRIKDVIYSQKFEGAVLGYFNANIITRELGLQNRQRRDEQLQQKQRALVRREQSNGDIILEMEYPPFMNHLN
ncbi:DNA-packaging protein [Spirosoma sp. RP8]|uniref:DNA-packaging protein n=1 Tax=Spirosoma liriopis TaxID=2937440 RepID=A0ABT0HE69_9BACT|nr:DNA-packaging protein [Spirosoma liriopis]MCK8490446.1 DNA-packaging protein [Spirosoma liriopis]